MALAYEPVEINATGEPRSTDRLGRALVRPGAPGARMPFQGVVLANEFLDALPVHRLVQEGGRLQELLRRLGSAAGARPSSPAIRRPPALAGTARGRWSAPWPRARWSRSAWPSSRGWPRSRRGLDRGLVLVIDYGHQAAALYDPARTGGTLRAYAGQRAHADPFVAIGRQDLTAHVDLTALEAAARGSDSDLLGDISQAEFLVGCGLEELVDRIRSDPATTMEDWLAARSAVARLLDPAALGGFRAVLLGRGLDRRAAAARPDPPATGGAD